MWRLGADIVRVEAKLSNEPPDSGQVPAGTGNVQTARAAHVCRREVKCCGKPRCDVQTSMGTGLTYAEGARIPSQETKCGYKPLHFLKVAPGAGYMEGIEAGARLNVGFILIKGSAAVTANIAIGHPECGSEPLQSCKVAKITSVHKLIEDRVTVSDAFLPQVRRRVDDAEPAP
jgi:hypothetical protein